MIQLLKLAIRDLGRNRRRSFFSSLALGMGLAVLLLMAAFIEGEIRGSVNLTTKLYSGHLQVRAKSYEEGQTSLAFEDLIPAPDAMAAKIAGLDAVDVATPRLYAGAIVVSGENTAGVQVVGIDPSSEANAPYRDGVTSGEFLAADDREGILIGKPLAEKLNLNTGDRINLMINTSSGQVDEQPFIIRGIYTTDTNSFDEVMAFMPLAKAQAITQANDYASTIFIMLKDRTQTEAVASALQTNEYKVVPWQELNKLILQTEEMANSYFVILYLIVLAVTATVIINTLVMAVFERTREIGILSALGMKSWRIMAMFFAESSLLAIGGIIIGLILGGLAIWYASTAGFYIGNMGMSGVIMGNRIYAYLTLKDTIQLTVLAFIVTLLASLYPALMAARMEPVDALRGGKAA